MSHAVVAAINEYCTAGGIAGFGAAASDGATVAAVGAAGACAAAKTADALWLQVRCSS